MEFTTPKSLTIILPKNSGRDVSGHVAMRHIGGRHKRYYRMIDFKRDKLDVTAKVVAIEYDPNRTSQIALLNYADGEKRYIVAPVGLEVGATVVASDTADIKPGNSLTLAAMPVGNSC